MFGLPHLHEASSSKSRTDRIDFIQAAVQQSACSSGAVWGRNTDASLDNNKDIALIIVFIFHPSPSEDAK